MSSRLTVSAAPRPWRLSDDGVFIVAADGTIVATVHVLPDGSQKANGLILAAAPELLHSAVAQEIAMQHAEKCAACRESYLGGGDGCRALRSLSAHSEQSRGEALEKCGVRKLEVMVIPQTDARKAS